MFRATPQGKLRVYRTRNGGKSWEALTNGLPQKEAYECVLRDGLGADALDPAGIYFGTRNGKLYGSPDGGASWTRLADGLPPVVCVKTAVVGAARKPARKSSSKVKPKAAVKRARPAKSKPKAARVRKAARRPAKKK